MMMWRRPDHTTSNIVRYGFQPATTFSGVVDTDREDVLDEQRFAVGHHELGRERRLGEPAADVGQRADRVGEDLAVAAEAVGDRDRAHLGASGGPLAYVAHRCPRACSTACWYSASVTSM